MLRRIVDVRLAMVDGEKVSERLPCSIGQAVGEYAQESL